MSFKIDWEILTNMFHAEEEFKHDKFQFISKEFSNYGEQAVDIEIIFSSEGRFYRTIIDNSHEYGFELDREVECERVWPYMVVAYKAV